MLKETHSIEHGNGIFHLYYRYHVREGNLKLVGSTIPPTHTLEFRLQGTKIKGKSKRLVILGAHLLKYDTRVLKV